MKPADFLRALFGDYVAGSWGLWCLQTKATTWTKLGDDKNIAKFAAEAVAKNLDAYFPVCAMNPAKSGRGSEVDVVAMPGVWADVDFAGKPSDGKPNAKQNYPTSEIADRAIANMPAAPTFRVTSGYGVHLYWLFDKPFLIASDADRARAKSLNQAWQGMFKAKLFKLGGYGLDSTHDLARVLRLPGTPHTKAKRLVEVEPAADRPRYAFEAIEAFVEHGILLKPATSTATQATGSKKTKPAPAAATPAAPAVTTYATATSEPPAVKLSNLIAASPEFAKLWSGKESKASPSEYDMSLANYAINAGWTDQEAAALLVAFARERQPAHVEKLLRVTGGVQDYLKLTVGKAHDRRVTSAAVQANEQAIDVLAVEVRAAERENREVERHVVLENVSKFLGVQVVGFRQTGRREELYSLLLKQHGATVEVIIGNASSIHSSPQRMCERLMAEAGKFVPLSSKLKKEWGAIISGLIAIRDFHDVQEAELSDRVRTLIDEYLTRNHGGFHIGKGADGEASKAKRAMLGAPFILDDKLYCFGPALKKLAAEIDRGIAGADLYVGLKQSGFAQVNVQIPGRKTTRSYWVGSAEGYCISEPADPRPLQDADLRQSRSNTRATPRASDN